MVRASATPFRWVAEMACLLRPAPGRGLRQVARQDALGLGSLKTEVEASTLSVSYTVTVGRYHYKHETCSRTVGYT